MGSQNIFDSLDNIVEIQAMKVTLPMKPEPAKDTPDGLWMPGSWSISGTLMDKGELDLAWTTSCATASFARDDRPPQDCFLVSVHVAFSPNVPIAMYGIELKVRDDALIQPDIGEVMPNPDPAYIFQVDKTNGDARFDQEESRAMKEMSMETSDHLLRKRTFFYSTQPGNQSGTTSYTNSTSLQLGGNVGSFASIATTGLSASYSIMTSKSYTPVPVDIFNSSTNDRAMITFKLNNERDMTTHNEFNVQHLIIADDDGQGDRSGHGDKARKMLMEMKIWVLSAQAVAILGARSMIFRVREQPELITLLRQWGVCYRRTFFVRLPPLPAGDEHANR